MRGYQRGIWLPEMQAERTVTGGWNRGSGVAPRRLWSGQWPRPSRRPLRGLLRARVRERDAPRVLHFVVPSENREGAGKTGCALHPRSHVQDAQSKTHTSIQVQRRQSGLPCAMVLRLIPCSCVRKICQNVRTGGSDQPPVAGSEPVRAQRPLRACRGARDRSGVFLNPNSCKGFEPGPSKEGSG